MTCETLEEQLSAWIDGELSRVEQAYVAAHLETCSACRLAPSISSFHSTHRDLLADSSITGGPIWRCSWNPIYGPT